MIRLGLLMLATLLGLFLVLRTLGDQDLRADRQPAPAAPVSAAQDAGAEPLTAGGTDQEPAEAVEPIVQAEAQTPERTVDYPGPELAPSPEYTDRTADEPVVTLGEEGQIMYVTASRVNMRSGPGTQNSVIDSLARGTRVEALGPPDGDWVQIRTEQDVTGYTSGQFLSSEAP
ncbi:SH3 domain-containing protein [Paracoccus sediminilitoris]|uniref:SH3 domain-containing protein n=1 Tax=Paracoccus sediminilitoris TaxID=2202419 RepID=UPI00272BF0AE|nr:SH3 domain-containing protein [Paracoccus sediminilitoris]